MRTISASLLSLVVLLLLYSCRYIQSFDTARNFSDDYLTTKMTEFTAFACTVGEANLCLFNSTCTGSGALDQECICQPGYMHDFTFFHSKNCGMPDLLLPIFVSIYSAVWLGIFVVLLKKSLAMGQSTAWLTRITIVYHISLEGCMALQAIQGGMMEGSIFFLCLMLWSMVVLIAQIIRQMFSFMNGMYADRIERMVSITNALSICYFVFNVVFAGTMITYARTDFYDVTLLVCISLHVTLLCTMALVVLFFMSGFLTDLDKNSRLAESPLLQDVQKRLRRMRYRWAFFFVNMFIAGACGIALRLVLRSLPFCFLITIMVWFNAMLLTLGVVSILSKDKKLTQTSNSNPNPGSKDSKPPSKNDTTHIGSFTNESAIAPGAI